jgi:endonuclease G
VRSASLVVSLSSVLGLSACGPSGAETVDGPDAGPFDGGPSADGSPDARAPSIHVALGIPADSDPSDDVLIDHREFVLSYNPRLRDPNWVSWHLEARDLGTVARQDSFHPDTLLPSVYPPVLDSDYRGSGYDRGHLCPSADRTSTVEANAETFVMTNMQPQLHGLNAGPWAQLEAYERQLVLARHEVYVVAGGIFDAAPATIGPGIAVPRASYKIVVVVEPGQGRANVGEATAVVAVVMANAAAVTGHDWREFATTVDEIERQTGYDFLNELPPPVQAALESRITPAP